MSLWTVQMVFLPQSPYDAAAVVRVNTTGDPQTMVNTIAAYVGGYNVTAIAAQKLNIYGGTIPPAQNLRDTADMTFDKDGGQKTRILIPSQSSWYRSDDSEQIDPFNTDVQALVTGMIAAGLCTTSGVNLNTWEGGFYVRKDGAPWPDLT